MELDHFCKNGVIVSIPVSELNRLKQSTTYKEKISAFQAKVYYHKIRTVCLTTVKEVNETRAIVRLPKYLTPYHYNQKIYPIQIVDNIKLHPQQKKYFTLLKTAMKEKQGICLNLKPGSGKTILAIKLLSLLKVKTVIVVHKEFLRDQWIESIVKFTDISRDAIGIIQGSVCDTDKPIIIAMLQTLWKKERLNIHYNLLIVDEVHNIGAEAFFKSLTCALPMCKYTLGLSGTTERTDGLSPLFEAYLGKIVKPADDSVRTLLTVIPYFLSSENEAYVSKVNKRTGVLDVVGITTSLATYEARTEYIFKIICKLQENKLNQILILSERISFLDRLKAKLITANIRFSCNYSKFRTYTSSDNGIILATYAMASEAFDVQDLNVLVLASSISTPNKFLQTIGRINRNCEINKSDKIIIDIVDKPFSYQYTKRLNLLRNNFDVIVKKGYEVVIN